MCGALSAALPISSECGNSCQELQGSGMPQGTILWVLGCCLEQEQVVCPLSPTCDSCPPQVPRDTPMFAAAAPQQGATAQPKVRALRTSA